MAQECITFECQRGNNVLNTNVPLRRIVEKVTESESENDRSDITIRRGTNYSQLDL